MAIKIAIACTKGGVSKTTTSFELASALARKKKKVLLFDLDPQGDCSTWADVKSGEVSIFNSLTEKDTPPPVSHINAFLDIIPSSSKLESFESFNVTGKEVRLKKIVDKLEDKYDFIVYDTQPAISFLVGNALVASDYVITPLTCDEFSVKGITKIIELIDDVQDVYNKNLKLGGILITNFHKGMTMHREALEYYKSSDVFKDKLFKTVIRQTQKIKTAVVKRISIYDLDKTSHAAVDYQKLAEEIIKKFK